MLFAGKISISDLAILIPAILLALTVHEFAHAWVASILGDDTARNNGRVTLNPFAHLDIMGTIVMVLTGFIGWAKPVPIDSRNFKNGLRDLSLVALAGPLSNVLLAAILICALALINQSERLYAFIPDNMKDPLILFFFRCFVINIAFAFLNILPIPPLDGFKALSQFLPYHVIAFCQRYQIFFMLFLILFIFLGPFSKILQSIISKIYYLILY
jgi:Zn-dependent protease